jgi:hypothetical protein
MSYEIEDTRTITTTWCICFNNVIQSQPINVNLNNLQFQSPDFVKIELFSVANNVLNDNMYVVYSNLQETDPILSFTGRQDFPVNMNSTIRVSKPLNTLNFQVQQLNPAGIAAGVGTFGDPTFGAGANVYISITFTLLRIKKYHNDQIKMASNR